MKYTKDFKKFRGFDIGKYTYGYPKVHYNKKSLKIGTLKIGKFCSISDNVQIFLNHDHNVNWVTTYPFPVLWDGSIKGHPTGKGDIIIGNDVWIGYGAYIFSGLTIGDGAVIAAGAIVTKDVLPYSIVGGNPAKIIRMRFPQEIIDKLLQIKWWDKDEETIKKMLSILCNSQFSVEDLK